MTIDSIRYKTYNNVIDSIKCVGEQHLQIKTVTTGDIFKIDLNKNSLFPLLHVDIINVEAGQSKLQHNFQLVIADMVEPDESENEQEVLSDTLSIALDIISVFKNGEILYHYNTVDSSEQPRYWTAQTFSLDPFTERFDNSLAGWTVDLPIVIEFPYETCNIPIDNSTICVK